MSLDNLTAGDSIRLEEKKAELIGVMRKGDADGADKAEENIREFLGGQAVSEPEIDEFLIAVRKVGLTDPEKSTGSVLSLARGQGEHGQIKGVTMTPFSLTPDTRRGHEE